MWQTIFIKDFEIDPIGDGNQVLFLFAYVNLQRSF